MVPAECRGFLFCIILHLLMKIEELYKIYKKYPSVQTDTRKIKAGDIFFALKGANFNGNEFAQKAIEEGAAYAVIDEKEFEIPGKTILVDDALISTYSNWQIIIASNLLFLLLPLQEVMEKQLPKN